MEERKVVSSKKEETLRLVEKVRKDREEGGERSGLSGKDGWVLCELCK